MFGGLYNTAIVEKLKPTHYGDFYVPDYIHNNFNDLASSIVILFELVVINNWPVNGIKVAGKARFKEILLLFNKQIIKFYKKKIKIYKIKLINQNQYLLPNNQPNMIKQLKMIWIND
ncbi:hypothetical protein PPERSA_09552 [Pseudocohnilembus persalinus]|uniref:Uncharacterized protein n=1 Tax=Pseudocohnilembus persalinus TaxID=266149 RepID=A0A0V0QFG6_PSEPJ|nr:hypothetical protein PPERSA_09552 [Pseudocohnilembus persalinus]|eukprot:KRX00946.1 hypothetical protein PPERSA_09552 [Pseudocohnilembus persalinus]